MSEAVMGDLMKNKVTGIFEETLKKDPVDWNDFNYPPYLKLIHFSVEDTPDEENKPVAKLLGRSYAMWCLFWPINLLVNILGCIMEYDVFGFMPLIYSITNTLLFVPIGTILLHSQSRQHTLTIC